METLRLWALRPPGCFQKGSQQFVCISRPLTSFGSALDLTLFQDLGLSASRFRPDQGLSWWINRNLHCQSSVLSHYNSPRTLSAALHAVPMAEQPQLQPPAPQPPWRSSSSAPPVLCLQTGQTQIPALLRISAQLWITF